MHMQKYHVVWSSHLKSVISRGEEQTNKKIKNNAISLSLDSKKKSNQFNLINHLKCRVSNKIYYSNTIEPNSWRWSLSFCIAKSKSREMEFNTLQIKIVARKKSRQMSLP